MRDFARAAAAGDESAVARWVAQQSGVPTGALEEALAAAAGAGHLAIVRLLVERGADVNAGDGAALMAAAAGGHLHVVKWLCEQGADAQARGGEALRLAARRRHGDVVRYLHGTRKAAHVALSGEGRRRIQAMRDEIDAAKPIYRPARIWEFLADVNYRMLLWGGERNFKRTVNQNYFNFIPTGLRDPRILRLARLWLRRPSLRVLSYRIEDPDRDPTLWPSWDERYYVFRDNHDFRLRMYRWFVACLFEYALATDRNGLLLRLEEPTLGNPIRVWRGSQLVSQDLVNSVRDRNVVIEALGLRQDRRSVVAELGAGYGRLGHVILATSPCRYFVFDIPPALYISEWYLSRLFRDRTVFRFRHFEQWEEVAEEVERADIAFFTANQLEMMPDAYVDAFVSISSLHEMRPEQIDHFMGLMGAKARQILFLKQMVEYVNPWDELTIRRDAYVLPPGWQVLREDADILNPGFFQILAARRKQG